MNRIGVFVRTPVMADDTDDKRLLAAVASGRPEAFNDFYDRFSRPLYALGLRWLQDASDAEELVSDTLVRAWQRADGFDPTRGSVASWLFGIARHVSADRWRVRQRHLADPIDAITEPIAELDTDGLADAFDIVVAVARLSDVHREVLVLAYGRDQTETQIADQLGIPVGTVKSRRFNALRALGRWIDPVTTPHPAESPSVTADAGADPMVKTVAASDR